VRRLGHWILRAPVRRAVAVLRAVSLGLSADGSARVRGPEPPSLGQAEAAVLAETPGGRVLSLAAGGLDELADVVEPGEAAAVDGLVHLAEASGLGWCSAGWRGEAEPCNSDEGSCGDNALHVTSFLLVGAGSPINGGSTHGVDQIAPHGTAFTPTGSESPQLGMRAWIAADACGSPMRTRAEIIGDSAHLVPTSRSVADQRSHVR
jgi:hypothetical protein